MTAPRWHNDHKLLAAVAKYLVAVEATQLGQLVDVDLLTADAAREQLRPLRRVAAGWRALAAIEPEPDHLYDGDRGGAWPFERRQALDTALANARARADAAPHDVELAGITDAVATLLWWETATPSARFLVDTTIALRARAATDAADRAAQPAFTFGVAA